MFFIDFIYLLCILYFRGNRDIGFQYIIKKGDYERWQRLI